MGDCVMGGWNDIIPARKRKRQGRREITPRPETLSEWQVTTKAQLKKCTKEELIDEVHRLQGITREVAVELGVARRSKSSEYTIDVHFVSNLMTLIKAAWSFNL